MAPTAPPRLAAPVAPRARLWAPLHAALASNRRRPAQKAAAAGAAGGLVVGAALAGAALAVTSRDASAEPQAPLHPAVADAVAGGLACGAMDIMFFADTLKVRRQSGVPLLQGGVGALFAGAGPSAAFRVLHGALYMPAYSAIKHALHDAGAPAAAAVTAAAAGATVLTALIEVPVEAVMLRLKSGSGGVTFGKALRLALRAPGGAAALWAGATPYVLRHVLYEAAEFVVYEHLREREMRKRAAAGAVACGSASAVVAAAPAHGGHADGLDMRTAALFAAAAGGAATVASHPVDCIRVAVALSGAKGAPLSATAAAAAILRAAGPAGFARGLLPRLAATVPGSVIFFSVFEAARARLAALEAPAGGEKHAAAAASAEKRPLPALPALPRLPLPAAAVLPAVVPALAS